MWGGQLYPFAVLNGTQLQVDPRFWQIGDGDGDGPPIPGKSGMGMGMMPRSPANRGWDPHPHPRTNRGWGWGWGSGVPCPVRLSRTRTRSPGGPRYLRTNSSESVVGWLVCSTLKRSPQERKAQGPCAFTGRLASGHRSALMPVSLCHKNNPTLKTGFKRHTTRDTRPFKFRTLL